MLETEVAMQLKETHHKIGQILQHKIAEYGIPFGLLFIAMKVYGNPDASQKEIAEQMKFTEGAMSSAVKKLISLNMLRQVPLESDLRYNRLVVTDFGVSIINDYKEYVVKKYLDIFDGFDDEELEKLQISLLKINKNLDKMNNMDNLEGYEE